MIYRFLSVFGFASLIAGVLLAVFLGTLVVDTTNFAAAETITLAVFTLHIGLAFLLCRHYLREGTRELGAYFGVMGILLAFGTLYVGSQAGLTDLVRQHDLMRISWVIIALIGLGYTALADAMMTKQRVAACD